MRGRKAPAGDAGGQTTCGRRSPRAASSRGGTILAIGLAAALLTLLLAATAGAARPKAKSHARSAEETVTITVLSSRADLVAGDEALLEITVPAGQDPHEVTVDVGSENETAAFSVQSGNTLLGVVTGLHEGVNTVTAQLAHGPGAQIVLTDHPQGGPLFAGPQVTQWTCEAGATDSQCNKPATYSYLYKSTNPAKTKLEPYDPESPPEDVATIEVNGHTVPFIVRTETGYQDRDQYSISTLYNPAEPWTAVKPQPQYAHKLLVTHGFGCGVVYEAENAPSTTGDEGGVIPGASWALAHGWAVMSTAMDDNHFNCDVVTQAESLLMAKERVIDQYGTLRYTVGTGCSGGSLTQQWVANAYPGIYQGILPTCSFPDTWSSAAQVFDYHMLNRYFANKQAWGSGVSWTPKQEAAVEGTPGTQNALLSDQAFFSAIEPAFPCPGTTEENRYNPTSNPGGVRCSIADLAINVFGERAESEWGPEEKEIGRGFAGVPLGNVGIQYGLAALHEGKITPAEFADLNAKIGGLDPESTNPVPSRMEANKVALRNAYRSGMINETNNMGQVAIIDCLGPNPEFAHDSYRTFAVKARLKRANGTAANQVIWEGSDAIIASPTCQTQALEAMNEWLSRVAADTRAKPLAKKIIRDRPPGIRARCYATGGEVFTNRPCKKKVVPVYGTPRTVAGDAITTDNNECQLQPLNPGSYGVTFTAEQLAELEGAFPKGVCNYGVAGDEQQPTVPWLTYQTPSGQLIAGGEPMGPAPTSTPTE
jgi:hypothetical protein